MSSALGVLLATLAAAFPLQDSKRPDDVLQKRDGAILVGRVLKIEGDVIEFFATGDREPRRFHVRELMPYSVYGIRLDRIDKSNGAARYELGEFCLANGLYSMAVREFEEAERLDPTLAEKSRKRREEARTQDARGKLEEAEKLHLAKNYEAAKDLLRTVLDRYADTPYAEEARQLDAKMAEEIARENEEKRRMLQAQAQEKERAKERAREEQERQILARAAELAEEAQKLWLEALDHEPKNHTRADRAWKSAEAKLLEAKRFLEFLAKSPDPETVKRARELEQKADQTLVKTYYRLGRLWAVELSYPTALEWINKGLKLPHDDHMDRLLNELLLQISIRKIAERAAGRGY